jgi:uncharacterized protein
MSAKIKLLGFSGVLVFLCFIMINKTAARDLQDTEYQIAVIAGKIQTVEIEVGKNSYPPILVQKGIPVKWVLNAKAENLNGCNNAIVVPKYNIQKKLEPGSNIVLFTPAEEGIVGYSCWMGMINSEIKVVDNISKVSNVSADEHYGQASNTSGTGPGCPCCSGGKGNGKPAVFTVGYAQSTNDYNEAVIDVDDNGYTPSIIIVERNSLLKLRFNPAKLNRCNETVVFPAFKTEMELSKGELETPPIKVSRDFPFTCWMGMILGYVKVMDDIKNVDVEAVKKEVAAYYKK